MYAGDGKHHPLGNVHGMVADALKILRDHQKIERIFAVIRRPGQKPNERRLDLQK